MSVHIRGVTGPNSGSINGIYDIINNEVKKIHEIEYQKRGDKSKWMEYNLNLKSWQVKSFENRSTDICWAYLPTVEIILPELCVGIWSVFDGLIWSNQPNVKLLLVSASILIKGATGPNASTINGIFDPTNSLHDGVPVYQKRSDWDKWMEYNIRVKKWLIKCSQDKGTDLGWAYITNSTGQTPESCIGSWKVTDGKEWSKQPAIKLVSVPASVQIRGIIGPNCNTINGIYDPCETSDCMPVYQKRNDSDIWLEYISSVKKWLVKSTKDKGTDKGWAYIVNKKPELPELCKGIWNITDGKVWVPQPQVKLLPVSTSIQVIGIEGSLSSNINGIYDPTAELRDDMPVYQKRGEPDKWMEYNNSLKKWQIKSTISKGTTNSWTNLTCDPPKMPELCQGIWYVYDSAEKTWEKQSLVHLIPVPSNATSKSNATQNSNANKNLASYDEQNLKIESELKKRKIAETKIILLSSEIDKISSENKLLIKELQLFRGDENNIIEITTKQIDERIDIMKNSIRRLENLKKISKNSELEIINIE